MKVSISRIKCYKACKRKFELKYKEGLEPVEKSEALEVGSSYHKLLEEMNNGNFEPMVEDDYSKANAMAHAYYKYIFPKFHVVKAEEHLEYDLGNGDILHGYVDAIADDGHIVEHKSTGIEITEQYEYNLLWDEQILAYMLMTGNRKVWYTICRKPTIRQRRDESDADFWHRMIDWYDEDTDSKIRLLEIERTDEEVEQFKQDLIDIINDIKNTKCFYKNTCHCSQYGRRCEYSSVCLHYDPDMQYLEFMKEDKEWN